MTEFPVPLDNLITYVKALHPDGGPLDNVADAFVVSARLDEQSDALIGYFVDQARKSGASWSQIGAAMGVSKQAAQKRFVPTKAADLMADVDQPFSRFTERPMIVGGSCRPPPPLPPPPLAGPGRDRAPALRTGRTRSDGGCLPGSRPARRPPGATPSGSCRWSLGGPSRRCSRAHARCAGRAP